LGIADFLVFRGAIRLLLLTDDKVEKFGKVLVLLPGLRKNDTSVSELSRGIRISDVERVIFKARLGV
jgi:hypothetical protein